MKNLYCVTCGKNRKLKKPKIAHFLEKTLVFSIIYKKFKIELKKYLKKKNQVKY